MPHKLRNLLPSLATGALLLGAPAAALADGQVLAGVRLGAVATAGADAKLRAFETSVLGPEHAAAHARQRALALQAQHDGSATAVRPQTATPPGVPVAVGGSWGAARPIPVIAINSIMLPTGKVLMFAYPARPGYPGYRNEANAFVWDPVTGTSDRVDPPTDPATGRPTNIWCGGASLLPDGRVLVTGGNVDDPLVDFHGLNTVFVFNPFTEQWDQPPSGQMAQGRWYPSQLLMPDGRTLIAGGLTRPGDPDYQGPGRSTDRDLEIFSPDGSIERQSGFFNRSGTPQLSGLYPRMFWMPSGRALAGGPYAYDTWFVTPSSPGTTASWTDVPDLSTDREWGNAVLLSGGRVMTLGGSATDTDGDGKRPAQSTTAVFDENAVNAGWQPGTPMAVARSHANSVLLPDGKVATIGGGYGEDYSQQYYRWLYSANQKQVELFDPSTPATPPVLGNAESEARTYHSTALLLPDGRVMSAGDDINGPGGPGTGTSSDTAEIYSPPYLFDPSGSLAPRPVIDQAPATATSGGQLDIQASGPAAAQAVLVAPGSATHATDMSQRVVALPAPQALPNGDLRLTLPSNVNLAPPGYYMLFLLSGGGVPSVSKFVRVDPSPDPTAPEVTLTAPVDGGSNEDGTPTYSGSAGTLPSDRPAITVRVYAGPTASGAPVQTRSGARSGATWTLDGSPALAPDTYTARAEQSDYAGNTGLSAPHTFTIIGPVKPPPPRPNVKLSLRVTGKLPRLRTLKHGKRFTLTVQVSEPGRVTLSARLDRGRKAAKSIAKPRTLAFGAAGRRRVTFTLTRAGLRLIAHRRHGVVLIRAKAFFTSKRSLPPVQLRLRLH